jgi:hypothetical protein
MWCGVIKRLLLEYNSWEGCGERAGRSRSDVPQHDWACSGGSILDEEQLRAPSNSPFCPYYGEGLLLWMILNQNLQGILWEKL